MSKTQQVLNCDFAGTLTLIYRGMHLAVNGFEMVLVTEAGPTALYWRLPFRVEDQERLGLTPALGQACLFQLNAETLTQEDSFLRQCQSFDPIVDRPAVFFDLERYTFREYVNPEAQLSGLVRLLADTD